MTARQSHEEVQMLSIEEFERLPEDDRYRDELVRGRLVREPRPGWEHGRVQVEVAATLRAHVREHGLGVVLVETGFVLEPGKATVRGPDVSYVTRNRVPAGGVPRGFPNFAPDLAVEVVSPANSARALREKVDSYLSAGVRQVWILYPRTRRVVVHEGARPPKLVSEDQELDGGDVVPGFRIRVAELFDI